MSYSSKILVCAALVGVLPITLDVQAQESDVLEEIVVKGYKSSLAKNLDLKRNSVAVRESIVAEDFGDFPDSNLAQALQRVPGIVLQRSNETGDEGVSVQVRGLGSEFTQVLLNGASVSLLNSRSDDRQFDFNVFAAELFSRVDFYKTSVASIEEGGISGTIDLRTPRPFDNDDRVIAYNVEGSQRELGDDFGSRISGLYSDTWGDFGFLVSAAYSDYESQVSGTQPVGFGNHDNNGDLLFNDPNANLNGFTEAELNGAYYARLPRPLAQSSNQTRLGVTTSLQYQPSDTVDIILDLMYADLDQPIDRFLFDGQFRSRSKVPLLPEIDEFNNLYGLFGGVNFRSENVFFDNESDFYQYALTAEFAPSGKFKFDTSFSFGESEGLHQEVAYLVEIFDEEIFIDPTVDRFFPTLDYSFDPTDIGRFTAPDALLSFRDTFELRESDVMHARFNGQYSFDTNSDSIENAVLKFGVSNDRFTRSNLVRDSRSALNDATRLLPDGRTVGDISLSEILVVGPGIDFPTSNSGFPTSFVTVTRDALGLYDVSGARQVAVTNGAASFAVKEESRAAYVQLDLDGLAGTLPYRFNFGIRAVDTDITINNNAVLGGAFIPQTTESSYTEVLPSLNASLEVAENVLLRVAYSKTISRPPLDDLGKVVALDNLVGLQASAGNANLSPLLSDAIDLSVEWYFSPNSLFSVTYFQKDLKDLIESEEALVPYSTFGLPLSAAQDQGNPTLSLDQIWTLTRPTNASEFEVDGIEIIYQQPFTFLPEPFDGFGAIANYTMVNTDGVTFPVGGPDANGLTEVPIQQPGIPESFYNITAYYEKGNFAGRISYNWVDEIISRNGSRGPEVNLIRGIIDEREVLDMQLSYAVNDNLIVKLEGQNLTESSTFRYYPNALGLYGDGRSRIDENRNFGRIFTIGLSGSF